MITLLGLFIGLIVCVWFMSTKLVVQFCVAITMVGMFDALDGALARLSGRVTKFGAYLDAVCDRYFDAMVALAVAWVTGYWFWTMLVLAGAQLVSYAKARAAMEVPISNREWPDLMERGERDALFIAGLAAGELIPWQPFGRDLFWWTLVLLAGLTHLTVVQRLLRARRFILSRGG